MRASFVKALKWFLVVVLVIAGIGLLHTADQAKSMKLILPAILCLGAAFVAGTMWKDLRKRILFISIVLVLGLAYAAQYFDTLVYIALAKDIETNYFMAWSALVFAAGVPFMTAAFYKYGD